MPAAPLLPPAGEAHAGPTATGLPPRAAACLAYAAWWASGALVLAVEPAHPFVRFHARQALVAFGALWLVGVALWTTSFVAAFVSPWLFRGAALLANLVWVVGLVAWGACLVSAARGRCWAVPWLPRRTGRRD